MSYVFTAVFDTPVSDYKLELRLDWNLRNQSEERKSISSLVSELCFVCSILICNLI